MDVPLTEKEHKIIHDALEFLARAFRHDLRALSFKGQVYDPECFGVRLLSARKISREVGQLTVQVFYTAPTPEDPARTLDEVFGKFTLTFTSSGNPVMWYIQEFKPKALALLKQQQVVE